MALATTLLPACSDDHDSRPGEPVTPPVQPPVEPESAVSARQATQPSDLLSGPLARGVSGDFVLENDRLRVIIQGPGRRWLGIGTYGGNIIDASAREDDGSFHPDHLEEFVVGVNAENTPNYTEVRVVSAGSDEEPAVICATGPDDLLEYANASSAIRDLGFQFPDSADDRDLPVEIETCYSLAAGDSHVVMDTTLRNEGSDDLDIYQVEYLNGSGQVEAFQPLAGFGEPLLTPACPADTRVPCSGDESGLCDQCNYLAFSGVDDALGVSYGLIHEVPGTTSFSTSGVNVLVLGQDVLRLITGQAAPNFTVPGNGELTLRRYFAVGDGTASSIADIRNGIFGIETGLLEGRVSSGGEPLAAAQVAVFQVLDEQTNPPALFMAGHSRTDANGDYQLNLPPGDYTVRANLEGYPFDPDDPRQVTIAVGASHTANFELPAPGYLEVTVLDEVGPGPAKLQLVGVDPSPPLRNRVSFSETGVFEDLGADARPFGIALVAFIDREGNSGRLTVEPGDYQLVVSRGPRYSAFKQFITVTPGEVTTVQGEIVRVIDDHGFVHGDFHVHGIDSPDSEVTRQERVAVYLAEGMDFFTPSDHDIRVDFSDTLRAMGVEDLIGTAPGSETTAFDYGHFNSWPVTVDPDALGGGALDWGRAAPAGMDFPGYGSFGLSPREIIDGLLADPRDNIVQINHIASHFGGDGLSIDTGLTPPRSFTDLAGRRLDPALGNGFDAGFQALELWIGTNGLAGIEGEFLNQNAGDWFNLINQGIVRTGVANSDSHQRRFTHISARNLIASDRTDPGTLSAHAEQLAASVRDGKSVGSNAPFLLVNATGVFNGAPQAAGLRLEENTVMAVDSGAEVEVTTRIATPAWAPLDRVEFYVNSQPQLTSGEGAAARYGICASAIVSAGDDRWSSEEITVNNRVTGATRTEITASLTLPDLTRDSWVVVIARGTDGVSEPLFPVLPASLDPAGNGDLDALTDGNLGEGGTPAFAFSNPLFIDVGGDGWSAPGTAPAPCTEP